MIMNLCREQTYHSPNQNEKLRREKRPGAYVIDHQFPVANANSMVVEMSETDLLIIDTPWTEAATIDLLNWLKEKFGQRKITVINTHSHLDRVAGNSIYIQNGAQIYSSDLTAHYLRIRKNAEPHSKLQEANHTFPLREGKILDFGAQKAEIFYPGHGHTKDNVVVYLPKYKILFGGCFIVGMPKLGNLKEANLKEWSLALDTLNRFDVRWVVPGHYGEGYSPELIQHTKNLVR